MSTGVESHSASAAEAPLRSSVGCQRSAPVTESEELPVPPSAHVLVRHAVMFDAVAVLVATYVAYLVRFGSAEREAMGPMYEVVCLTIAAVWMLSLSATDAYDPRIIIGGNESYKRQALATVRVLVLVAVASYLLKLELARLFVFIALPLGMLLLFLARWGVHRWLAHEQAQGRLLRRILVVGDAAPVEQLVARLTADARGYLIVGACAPTTALLDLPEGVPALVATPAEVPGLARQHQAQTVILASSSSVAAEHVKQISWDLEGSGIDVAFAPSLVDIAGPRLELQPVAGVPMLHVLEPEFRGSKRVLKRLQDVLLALAGLLVLSPVLAVLALCVKATSRGPVFFRQERVGQHGESFRVWKFRSMHIDAERRLTDLQAANEGAGLLFKMRNDPRVTSAGRWMRRYSLDELPQLLNVLDGSMSLVGPRPPLPREVAQYSDAVKRRLLVRPGITGLWQVSGRSDLSWDEAVRLDLYYVENWSMLLDVIILLRTVRAVLRSSGAY